MSACEELGLTRLVEWLIEVLERPADVCDVAALPSHVYVALARKLHVRYEGPPTPSAFSPCPSFDHRGDTPYMSKRTSFGSAHISGAGARSVGASSMGPEFSSERSLGPDGRIKVASA